MVISMISTDSFIVASRILDGHKLVGYLTMSNDGTLVYMDLDTFKKYVIAEKFKDVIYDKKSKRPRGTLTPLNKYPSMQYSKVKSHMNQSRPVDTKQTSQRSENKKQVKTVSKTRQVKTLQNREKAERYLAKCNLTGRYELQLNVRSKDRVEVIGVNKNLETITIPDFVTDFKYKVSSNKMYIDSWCKGAKFTKFVWNNISYTGKTIGLFSGLSQKTLDIQISHPEKIKNLDFMFYSNVQLIEISGLENLSNIEQMRYTFKDCRSLKSFDFVRTWNTSRVKQMNSCFDSQSIKDLQCLSNWNVQSVEDMSEMFYCTQCGNQWNSLSNWNTKSLRNADNMFDQTDIITTDFLKNFNFDNVESIEGLFEHCHFLKSLKTFSKLKMPKVTQLKSVFSCCRQLENLDDLMYMDVQHIENLDETFEYCTNLKSLRGLKNWDTSRVRSLKATFADCGHINFLDGLENWDISNVKDLTRTFVQCRNLYDIGKLKNWNVQNVENMSYTFTYCDLQDLQPLKNWDVRKVKTMNGMFYGNMGLMTLAGLENWKTDQLECTYEMFAECLLNSLAGIKNWNTQKIQDGKNMFSPNLEIYDYPEMLKAFKKPRRPKNKSV